MTCWTIKSKLPVAALCVGWTCAIAGAQNTRTLIEQALDEPTKISLKNIKLGDAIEKLTEQTGVTVVMSDESMKLLPHGPDTLVTEVVLENVPLREAFHRLFDPLGMSLHVRDNDVEILPKPALLELGRPPQWEELDTLAQLGQMEPGVHLEERKRLEPLLQFQVPIRNGWSILFDALSHVGAGSGDEVLTVACKNLGWSWSLSGKHIVIVPMQKKIRERLSRPISLRRSNSPLHEIIQAVSKAAGVPITTEPGILASLPMEIQRNFSLTAYRQPADQVLDSIAAYTGLGYVIEPDGVLFYDPSTAASREPRRPPGERRNADDPIVARITVPLENGQTAEWLIRASELPPDLKTKRDADLQNLIHSLRAKTNAPNP